MTYDPVTYWQARGEHYELKFDSPAYAEQEQVLGEYLSTLEFGSVLDVGCGFGRIGTLLGAAVYTGIDLSPTLLESARRRMPHGEFEQVSLSDFAAGGRKWDLVIAVEFLMHVPPGQIESAVRKLIRLSSRHVVTLDWAVALERRKISGHNFLYDYEALLGDTGFGRTRPVDVVEVPPLQRIHHIEKAAR